GSRVVPYIVAMSPRRRDRNEPEQLILPPTPAANVPKPKRPATPPPEQAAKNYIARRTKPSAVPGPREIRAQPRPSPVLWLSDSAPGQSGKARTSKRSSSRCWKLASREQSPFTRRGGGRNDDSGTSV